MIQTIRNAWAVPELRRKILFTIFALLIFRLGSAIPVPYIDTEALQSYLDMQSGTILGLMNAMSGTAFSMATIFALSVQPYINSSIIIQLLTVAIPALERLAKEGGEEGRKKIASITRYTTVAIGLLQGFGYYSLVNSYGMVNGGGLNSIWVGIVIVLSFTAGSAFLMWLGEQITEFGIGNGISVLLFAGIVSRFPHMVSDTITGVSMWNSVRSGTITADVLVEQGAYSTVEDAQRYLDTVVLPPWMIAVILIGLLALVVLIVFISNFRAPPARPVCQAGGGPEDVRRPVHPHPHEAEHGRRHAHHLRPVHRHAARHHRRLRRVDHRERGLRRRPDAAV